MKKVVLFAILLATILVTIWFRGGQIMGTAEDGLIFYNISNYLPESQFAWMEHPGLGRVTIGLTSARPTYEALSFLQKLGLPGFIIQAITLWFILVSAGVGVCFIVKEFFPKLPNKYIILSALFYWFNPLSLVNIWNRFLLDYVFSFGLLPVVLLFFIKGLKRRNYLWSFVLVMVLPLYSFTFTYLAFDIMLWIVLFITTILFLLVYRDIHVRLFYIKFFFLTLLLFLLTNLWWIGQVFSLMIYKNIYSSVLNYDIKGNLGTLDALSKKMGNLSDIFRFSTASFLNENSLPWVRTFSSFPFKIAQYLTFFAILYSIAKNIKNRSVLILGGLFFVSIFLGKGTNPPFGEIYQFIFTNVSYFQVFRNPFEKFAPTLALSASLLIGFSIFSLNRQLPKKIKKIIYIISSGFLVVWGYPFYTGLVFTTPEPPANDYQIGYKVEVPEYYGQTDDWLKNKGSNFRFIGFPLGDEGITYNWKKGYSGVELSSALFATPGILHKTAVPYFQDLVPHIQESLLTSDNFLKLANLLNAKFFLVRHDINYTFRKMENPIVIDDNLAKREKNNEIKKVATFGKLTIWENLKWQDVTFYPASKAVAGTKNQQMEDLLRIDVKKGEVLIDEKDAPVLDSANISSISYKKINPSKYVVHVKNSSPFILVFSELFNDAWQAGLQNNVFKHMRVNFYANGWVIDKIGEFEITIEYLPQRLLEFGEKASFVSYILVVLSAIFMLFKRKKMK